MEEGVIRPCTDYCNQVGTHRYLLTLALLPACASPRSRPRFLTVHPVPCKYVSSLHVIFSNISDGQPGTQVKAKRWCGCESEVVQATPLDALDCIYSRADNTILVTPPPPLSARIPGTVLAQFHISMPSQEAV